MNILTQCTSKFFLSIASRLGAMRNSEGAGLENEGSSALNFIEETSPSKENVLPFIELEKQPKIASEAIDINGQSIKKGEIYFPSMLSNLLIAKEVEYRAEGLLLINIYIQSLLITSKKLPEPIKEDISTIMGLSSAKCFDPLELEKYPDLKKIYEGCIYIFSPAWSWESTTFDHKKSFPDFIAAYKYYFNSIYSNNDIPLLASSKHPPLSEIAWSTDSPVVLLQTLCKNLLSLGKSVSDLNSHSFDNQKISLDASFELLKAFKEKRIWYILQDTFITICGLIMVSTGLIMESTVKGSNLFYLFFTILFLYSFISNIKSYYKVSQAFYRLEHKFYLLEKSLNTYNIATARYAHIVDTFHLLDQSETNNLQPEKLLLLQENIRKTVQLEYTFHNTIRDSFRAA